MEMVNLKACVLNRNVVRDVTCHFCCFGGGRNIGVFQTNAVFYFKMSSTCCGRNRTGTYGSFSLHFVGLEFVIISVKFFVSIIVLCTILSGGIYEVSLIEFAFKKFGNAVLILTSGRG